MSASEARAASAISSIVSSEEGNGLSQKAHRLGDQPQQVRRKRTKTNLSRCLRIVEDEVF